MNRRYQEGYRRIPLANRADIHCVNALSQNKWMNYSFGTLVTLFTMIPFLNLVVMPVAVCGATAMWVAEYRNFFLNNPTDEFTGADYTFSKAKGSAVSPHVKGRGVRQSSNDIRS